MKCSSPKVLGLKLWKTSSNSGAQVKEERRQLISTSRVQKHIQNPISTVRFPGQLSNPRSSWHSSEDCKIIPSSNVSCKVDFEFWRSTRAGQLSTKAVRPPCYYLDLWQETNTATLLLQVPRFFNFDSQVFHVSKNHILHCGTAKYIKKKKGRWIHFVKKMKKVKYKGNFYIRRTWHLFFFSMKLTTTNNRKDSTSVRICPLVKRDRAHQRRTSPRGKNRVLRITQKVPKKIH